MKIIIHLFILSSIVLKAAGDRHPIKPEHELIITSPSVVNSKLAKYPGPLSFGRLLEANYGKNIAPEIAKTFILSFARDTTVNEQTIPARELAKDKVIAPWQKKDGYTDSNLDRWRPNLANAPFKLTAIVNRQDIAIASSISPVERFVRTTATTQVPPTFGPTTLPRQTPPTSSRSRRRTAAYYSSGFTLPAGEMRLVYCLTNQDGSPIEGGMTVILEFDQRNLILKEQPESSLQVTGENNHLVAKRWNSLSSHEGFNLDYMDDLCDLVSTVASKENTPKNSRSRTPSRLLRIRTNDSALGKGREFRQFNSAEKHLFPSLLSASINDRFYEEKSKSNKALSRYINRYKVLPEFVEVGLIKVPTSTAHSIVQEDQDTMWNGRAVRSQLRRHISMNSCIGCHGGETGTSGFHLAPPVHSSLPTLVSSFLANQDTKNRQKSNSKIKAFNKSGELARRLKIQKLLLRRAVVRDSVFDRMTRRDDLTIH